MCTIDRLSPIMLRTFVLNGDGEVRTLDPLLARQVLSQLSYIPLGVISIQIKNGLKWT